MLSSSNSRFGNEKKPSGWLRCLERVETTRQQEGCRLAWLASFGWRKFGLIGGSTWSSHGRVKKPANWSNYDSSNHWIPGKPRMSETTPGKTTGFTPWVVRRVATAGLGRCQLVCGLGPSSDSRLSRRGYGVDRGWGGEVFRVFLVAFKLDLNPFWLILENQLAHALHLSHSFLFFLIFF